MMICAQPGIRTSTFMGIIKAIMSTGVTTSTLTHMMMTAFEIIPTTITTLTVTGMIICRQMGIPTNTVPVIPTCRPVPTVRL
jgi:hypothetical protein